MDDHKTRKAGKNGQFWDREECGHPYELGQSEDGIRPVQSTDCSAKTYVDRTRRGPEHRHPLRKRSMHDL
jgi:hypothetical protein